MEKKKAFGTHGINKFQLHFPNGNWLSTVWGLYTYSDNYDIDEPGSIVEQFQKPRWSNTVEIMFECSEKLEKKILKKYNEGADDPIGRLTFNQWLEIVNLLSKETPNT